VTISRRRYGGGSAAIAASKTSVPAVFGRFASTAHLPTSARFRARAPGPVSGQLYETASGGAGHLFRFPAAFRPPAFASWASCPARGFRPPYGRPTAPQAARTRAGFPCSARVRRGRGWGRPLYPGDGGACTATCESRNRRLPPCNGRSLSPRCHDPSRDVFNNGASATVHWRSPLPAIPLTCSPRTEREPLGFPWASHPAGPSRACQGGDEPQALARDHAVAISGLPQRTHSPRAASCRNSPCKCSSIRAVMDLGNPNRPRSGALS